LPTQENVSKQVGKDTSFISAADRFNALSEEDQDALHLMKVTDDMDLIHTDALGFTDAVHLMDTL